MALLKRKEAAEHYRQCPERLDRWEKTHGMPVYRVPGSVPLYDTVKIDKWLEGFLTGEGDEKTSKRSH